MSSMEGIATLRALATREMNDMTSRLAVESRPLVGSSRKRIFGAVTSWLATETRLFCPPLSPLRTGVPMSVSAQPDRPNAARMWTTRSRRLLRGRFLHE